MSDPSTAPQPTNILNGEILFQRLLILHGTIPDPRGQEGRITIQHDKRTSFPDLNYPVHGGVFKALVHLEEGPNEITLTAPSSATTTLTLIYRLLPDNLPIRPVILLASDSPSTFDTLPANAGPWGNDLFSAIARTRTMLYLWQAFLAEQMYRGGFGRRTFPIEEAIDPENPDTLSVQDMTAGTNKTRKTAKIHIVRSKRTTAEIRHREHAQQWKEPKSGYHKETDGASQFTIAMEALEGHPDFQSPCHIVLLTLDAHWDPQEKLILGHAALGGSGGVRRLGVFGSHLTYSWPRWLEEVEQAFMDPTPTDLRHLADDNGEAGEAWKAANIGIGAFLHEAGHMLNLMHTPSGIMSRGFNNLNRSFLPTEPHSTKVFRPTLDDEAGAHWHRSDILRLRIHPSLSLPGDHAGSRRDGDIPGATLLPVPGDKWYVRCPGAIASIEYWVNDRLRHTAEYPLAWVGGEPSGGDTTETVIDLNGQIKPHLGDFNPSNDKLEIIVVSPRAADAVNHFPGMERSSGRFEVRIPRLPSAGGGLIPALTSAPLGLGAREGSRPWELFFGAGEGAPTGLPRLRRLIVRSGGFVDGMILECVDPVTGAPIPPMIVGNPRGGHADELVFAEGEGIARILVRCGAWIDGIQIITTHGREMPWMGGKGGGLRVLEPPTGCVWAGIKGSGAGWFDALQMVYVGKEMSG